MNTNFIPFEIGEQYELNEFNLEYIETKLIGEYEYEVYKYIKGDINSLFGNDKLIEIRLYYNADILSSVVYKYESIKFGDYYFAMIANFAMLAIIANVTF